MVLKTSVGADSFIFFFAGDPALWESAGSIYGRHSKIQLLDPSAGGLASEIL